MNTPLPPPPDRLQPVLDSLSEGVLALDPGRRVVLANPALRSLLNSDPSQSVGRPLWEILRHRELGEMVDRVLAGGDEEQRELRFDTGQEQDYRVRVYPLPEGPIRAVLTFSDITHVKRLENMRKEFVANVSHELKTPLTALRAAIDTLLDGALTDARHAKDFLYTAQQEAERLQHLIEDLLTLSLLERPGARVEESFCSLNSVTQRVLSAMTPMALKAGVTVEINLPSPPMNVSIRTEELIQVIMNVLDNAIKFNRPGGRVFVRARREDTQAVMEIQDTGVGLSAEEAPRVFERFYRTDKSRSNEKSGTGLGLSIVKHIVENRRGAVQLESVPGEGSTFRILLPISESVSTPSVDSGRIT